jgi:hypothetical protein
MRRDSVTHLRGVLRAFLVVISVLELPRVERLRDDLVRVEQNDSSLAAAQATRVPLERARWVHPARDVAPVGVVKHLTEWRCDALLRAPRVPTESALVGSSVADARRVVELDEI